MRAPPAPRAPGTPPRRGEGHTRRDDRARRVFSPPPRAPSRSRGRPAMLRRDGRWCRSRGGFRRWFLSASPYPVASKLLQRPGDEVRRQLVDLHSVPDAAEQRDGELSSEVFPELRQPAQDHRLPVRSTSLQRLVPERKAEAAERTQNRLEVAAI